MPDDRRAPLYNLYDGWEERPDSLGEYRRHPAAIRPTPYPARAFNELIDGVDAKGQQYPVELYAHSDEKLVLRGWHMLLACRALGIEPRTVRVEGSAYPEVRTDEQVEVYTAAEGSGRNPTAAEKALRTKELVYPAFKERALARRAGGVRLEPGAERDDALKLACKVTGASRTYVAKLNDIEDRAPPIYAALRKAILAGEEHMVVEGLPFKANINTADNLLDEGWDDDAEAWRMPASGGAGPSPRPPDAVPIPDHLLPDLEDISHQLGVADPGLAIKALIQFHDQEGEAWSRFLDGWRAERGRRAGGG